MAKETPKIITNKSKSHNALNFQESDLTISTKKTIWWIYSFLALAIFLVYGNSLKNGFVADDLSFVLKHLDVQNGNFVNMFKNGSLVNSDHVQGEQPYRPLMLVALAIEHKVFQNAPKGFHFVNLFLYFILSSFLFNFFRLIFKDKSFWLSLICTLVFVLHPIHTEVVNNIKSIDEILVLLFVLLSLNLLLKSQSENNKINYAFSLFFYVLALFSKENAIVFVVIIPATLYFFSHISNKNIAKLSSPFAIFALIYLFIRSQVIKTNQGISTESVKDNVVNWAHGSSEILGTKMAILLQYIKMLFVPYPLSWDYSFSQIAVTKLISITSILSIIIYLALVILMIWGFKKKNILSYAILFFLSAISITSNFFITTGSTFGERFLFTASVAFSILIGYLYQRFNDKYKLPMFSALGLIFIVSSVIIVNRNSDWKNNESLFKSGVETSPNSNRTHLAYGDELLTKARLPEITPENKRDLLIASVDEFEKSLKIYPNNDIVLYKMGVTLNTLGENNKALPFLEKAVALNPNFSPSNAFLGNIYFSNKDYPNAIKYFKKVAELNPNNGDALSNLGVAYMNNGDKKLAKENLLKAIELDPKNVNVKANLEILNSNP